MRAYRFAVDPSAAQARALEPHAGAARCSRSTGRSREVTANIGRTDAPNAPTAWMVRTSLLRGDGTCPRLRRACSAATSEIAPWWSECSTEAFNTGLDGVARSPEELGGLQGPPTRAGRTVGFPRFKGPPSHHTQRAVHHRGDPRLRPTVSMCPLPRVGTITTHEPGPQTDPQTGPPPSDPGP